MSYMAIGLFGYALCALRYAICYEPPNPHDLFFPFFHGLFSSIIWLCLVTSAEERERFPRAADERDRNFQPGEGDERKAPYAHDGREKNIPGGL